MAYLLDNLEGCPTYLQMDILSLTVRVLEWFSGTLAFNKTNNIKAIKRFVKHSSALDTDSLRTCVKNHRI